MTNAIEFRTNLDLQRFAGEVENFCGVVEKHGEYSVYDFVLEMDQRLASLYALARRLPDLEFSDDEPDELEAERKALSEQFNLRSVVYWDLYKDELDQKLKPVSRYNLVFDPILLGEPPEGSGLTGGPVESGFGEDIGSVYGDLKEALDLYRQGSEAAAQQAAWDWKFGLFHWGKHALNVVGATYALIHWHSDEETGGFDR